MLLSTNGCGILQLLRYIMVLRSVVLSIYIHLLLQTHQRWPVVGRVMSTLDFIIRVMCILDFMGRGPNNCSMILDAFRMAEWAHLFKSLHRHHSDEIHFWLIVTIPWHLQVWDLNSKGASFVPNVTLKIQEYIDIVSRSHIIVCAVPWAICFT